MAATVFQDFCPKSIPTPIRRFRHMDKSAFKTAGSMKIPKTDSGDLIVVTGSTKKFKNCEPGQDLLHFENVREFDSTDKKKWRRAKDNKFVRYFKIFLASAFHAYVWLMIYLKMLDVYASDVRFVNVTCNVVGCVIVGILYYFIPRSFISTRAIKWTLDEFNEKIRGYFFTSPTIHDKSGSWRLVLRQVSDKAADFGLIATEIAKDCQDVVANIEISTRIGGRNTVPGTIDILKFDQKYEGEGDCGYSTPICLSFEQLKNHTLEIKCRIRFTRKNITFMDVIKCHFRELIHDLTTIKKDTKNIVCPAAQTSENASGVILSETKFQSQMEVGPLPVILTGTELEGDSLSFMKHPETKVFFWKIPNFSSFLKNVECWEIFSPKLLVSSHGFCSIWCLQLLEMEGVFHIQMELRGLPRGISKIKMRYLTELMDNCGEFVAPNNCGSTTIKYPEHLDLNSTAKSNSVPLYRREAILQRFLDEDDTLNLRISFHCEPNDSQDFSLRTLTSYQMLQKYLRSFE